MYVAKRRAKPIVSTSGSSRSWPSRSRTISTSSRRPALRMSQITERSSVVDRLPVLRGPARCQSSPTSRLSSSSTRSLTHVRACTPFVTWPIGAFTAGSSGHMPPNICRDTSPWRRATPFDRAAKRRPITAMLNLPSGSSARVPSSNSVVELHPALLRRSVVKYCSNSSRGKRSMPAGTGVCVVNTPPARTASTLR